MATLIGGTGNDNLIGTFGDDVLDNGGGGSDTLQGSQGDDVIRFSGSVPVGNLAYSQIDGGIGHDILDLTGFQGHMLTQFDNGQLDLYEWDTGKDGKSVYTDIARVTGIEEVHLGAGVTMFDVSGVSGESIVQAGWTILGGDEADQIVGGVGADTIDAGAGNDMVTFNGGSDRIALGAGDDELFYAASSVFSGHSQIDGGAGTDSLFVFPDATLHSPAISIDLVAGTGQVGNDTLAITSIENVQIGQDGDIAAHASSIFVGGSDGANQIMVSGADQALVLGRDGDDSIQTLSLGGTLIAYGGAGNDVVVGGAGADWINGDGQYPGDATPGNAANGGADQLLGEDGNDHIWGNSQAAAQGSADGNDSIYAGNGLDYVTAMAAVISFWGKAGTTGCMAARAMIRFRGTPATIISTATKDRTSWQAATAMTKFWAAGGGHA